METENRSILIFFSIIVLLIFLDYQSAHQMRLVGATPVISKVESLRALTESELNSAGEEISNEIDSGIDLNKKIFQPALEKGSTKAEEIIENLEKIPKIEKIKLTKRKLNLKEVSLQNLSNQENVLTEKIDFSLPVLATIKSSDGKTVTKLSLFYPGFRGRETIMMSVNRVVQGSVNPNQALELLQAGPLYTEKGLVNSFDTSIKVERLIIQNHEAKVFVSKSMHQMSAIVRRDRLDQLCLTLFQFKEIKSIRIFIEGIEVTQLGKGKDAIALNQPITSINRHIEDFR